MKQQPSFTGAGVALVTPFLNNQVDFEALERIIEHVVEGGVEYIVSMGTTGEALTLSDKECERILRTTVKQVDGRIPVVAGFFGHNNTAQLVEKVKQMDFSGVDAILSSSPSYNKPTQEGIFQHYMALAAASPLPIIIYNVPSRTATNVEPETILRLAAASKKFIAVKEASGVIGQSMKLIKHRPEGFLVLSGDDPITLPIIACGGDGVISVMANVYPTEFSGMVRAALRDDMTEARRLNNLLLDIHKWLYIEGNPSGIKAAMEIRGLCTKEVRLPLVPLTDGNYSKLEDAMALVH